MFDKTFIKKLNYYFESVYGIKGGLFKYCHNTKNEYSNVLLDYCNAKIKPEVKYQINHELKELLPDIQLTGENMILPMFKVRNSVFLEKIEQKLLKTRLSRANLKKRSKNKDLLLVYFDTETEEIFAKGVKARLLKGVSEKENHELRKDSTIIPWVIGYKIKGKLKIVYKGSNYFQEFFDDLLKYSANYHIVLIGHNVQYDIEAMVPVFRYHGIKVNSKLLKNSCFYSGFTTGNLYISFHDTMRFKKMSLEKATKTKKLEVPYGLSEVNVTQDKVKYFCTKFLTYKTFPREIMENYLAQDVENVEKIVKDQIEIIYYLFKELLEDDRDIEDFLHLSEAGISQEYTKLYTAWLNSEKHWYHERFRYEIDEKEYINQRCSIIAGLTGFNTLKNKFYATKDKEIYKYDVISMYPKIIQNGVPGGNLLDKKPKGKSVTWYLIEAIAKVPPEPYPKYSIFSTPAYKKVWFYGSHQRTFYLVEDLYKVCAELYPNFKKSVRLIKKVYQEVYLDIGIAQEELTIRKMKIDTNLKANPPNKTDLQLRRSGLKIVLNSIYGKLMEASWSQSKYYFDGELITLPNEDYTRKNSLGGIYIAQMGRARLFKTLMKCIDLEVEPIYWDTDSITLLGHKNKAWEKEIFGLLDEKIGSWGYEGRFKEGYLFGVKKKYFLEPYGDEDKAIDKAWAFSGIKGLPELLKYLYTNNKDRYKKLKELLIDKNPMFLGVKQAPILTTCYKQKLLYNVDVILIDERNLKIPVTNKILLKGNDFEIVE